MMRFTQRMANAVKNARPSDGQPRSDAATMVRIAPMLVDSWKVTNLMMLS